MRTLRTLGLLAISVPSLAILPLVACDGGAGDPAAPYNPNVLGTGNRVSQISNPASPKYAGNGSPVSVSGASVLWLDTFDETQDGKSRGTLYMEDVAANTASTVPSDVSTSPFPFSGIALYKQSLVPANHTATPGDVFNLTGSMSIMTSVGTAVFPAPEYTVQIATPTCSFEYEYAVPPPKLINLSDLAAFDAGLPWTGMLVTVKNVTVATGGFKDVHGRVTYPLMSGVGNLPVLSNELYDLTADAYPPGTTFESITGIVTWFFNYQIAPRTADDLVVAKP